MGKAWEVVFPCLTVGGSGVTVLTKPPARKSECFRGGKIRITAIYTPMLEVSAPPV